MPASRSASRRIPVAAWVHAGKGTCREVAGVLQGGWDGVVMPDADTHSQAVGHIGAQRSDSMELTRSNTWKEGWQAHCC